MAVRKPSGAELALQIASPNPLLSYEGRCIRLRGGSECLACQDACPRDLPLRTQGALLGEEETAECLRCGACVSVCPSHAFALPERQYSRWIREIDALAADSERPTSMTAACAPASSADSQLQVACLRSWDVSLVLNAWARGIDDVRLVTADCASCPAGGELDAFAWVPPLARLGELLEPVRTLSLIGTAPETEAAADPASLSRTYDRRAFFDSLRHRAADALIATTKLGETASAVEGEGGAGEPSVSRYVAVAAWRTLAPDPATGDPLADEDVALLARTPGALCTVAPGASLTADCTFCGDCVRFCPVGAMRIRMKDEELRLSVDLGRCVGCGLCEELCRFDALEMRSRGSSALLRSSRLLLARAPSRTCTKCHKVYAGTQVATADGGADRGPSLCPTCTRAESRFASWY